MRLLSNIFILFVSFAILGSSCKATQKTQEITLKKAKSSKVLMKRMIQNQVEAEWLASKAKITVRTGNDVTRFTSHLRWRKDSVLWMVFKKASIEAARVQMTPDSLFIINRLEKEYAIKDFDFLKRNFHFPLGFDALQTLLLGNPVFFTKDLKSDIDDNHYHLEGKTDNYVNEYWLEGVSMLFKKIFIEDYRNRQLFEMELGAYGEIEEGKKFSYFRNLNLNSRELGEVSIKIELSKVELDVPKTIRFQIPEHYKRID